VTLFRPCIDLHQGRVKQIVGGTLTGAGDAPRENFVSDQPAAWFAALYEKDGLGGGHVIQLGPGNELAARLALATFPGGLQVGGGVRPDNARAWLDAGASQVIVTSYLFDGGIWTDRRLEELLDVVAPHELVIDLSCRRTSQGFFVATDRWQTITSLQVNPALLERLAGSCVEFLIHAADVEGLCRGIDEDLVRLLGESSPIPAVYAGGGRALSDLDRVEELSAGRVHLTFGSALDVFGGQLVRYQDCVAWNQAHAG